MTDAEIAARARREAAAIVARSGAVLDAATYDAVVVSMAGAWELGYRAAVEDSKGVVVPLHRGGGDAA